MNKLLKPFSNFRGRLSRRPPPRSNPAQNSVTTPPDANAEAQPPCYSIWQYIVAHEFAKVTGEQCKQYIIKCVVQMNKSKIANQKIQKPHNSPLKSDKSGAINLENICKLIAYKLVESHDLSGDTADNIKIHVGVENSINKYELLQNIQFNMYSPIQACIDTIINYHKICKVICIFTKEYHKRSINIEKVEEVDKKGVKATFYQINENLLFDYLPTTHYTEFNDTFIDLSDPENPKINNGDNASKHSMVVRTQHIARVKELLKQTSRIKHSDSVYIAPIKDGPGVRPIVDSQTKTDSVKMITAIHDSANSSVRNPPVLPVGLQATRG